MSEKGPVFSNGTQGDIWYSQRCNLCKLRDREDGVDGPCDEFFFPAMLGEWPGFVYRDPAAPEGVECERFEPDPDAEDAWVAPVIGKVRFVPGPNN